jgi:hypothetical protein
MLFAQAGRNSGTEIWIVNPENYTGLLEAILDFLFFGSK